MWGLGSQGYVRVPIRSEDHHVQHMPHPQQPPVVQDPTVGLGPYGEGFS